MAGTVLNPHFVASQGGYSRDRAIGVYARMGSNFAMCCNDWEMARYILARGGTPILRIRVPDDDDADSRFDPLEYVDTCNTELSTAEAGIPGAAGKGIVHLGNELGSANPERTARWLEAGIRRTTFHKRKVVAANWSVKNPAAHMHAELARFGVYRAVNENGGWVGHHEGAYIDPHTGETFRSFEQCLASGAIGGFRAAQQQYGFRVMVTEFAASKTPVDGWSTWMTEEEFAALCDKAAKFYAALGVMAHVYTAFPWDRGTGFEYVDAPTLQAEFAKINERYPVMTQPTTYPIPDGGGERAALASIPGEFVNIRAQPNPASATQNSSTDVGDLLVGDEVTWFPNAKVGQWVYIEPLNPVTRPAGRMSAAKGWVSLQNGAVQFVPPLLPPIPAPTGRLISPEAQARLRAHLKAIDDATAAIMAELDSAPEIGAPPSSGGGF